MATRDEKFQALQKIREANQGVLRASDVVKAARDPRHVLHKYFEWDDRKASERYRLLQARALARSVKILIRIDSKVIKTVVYVRDPRSGHKEQGYTYLIPIKPYSEDARAILLDHLQRARNLLESVHRRSEILGYATEIGELLDQMSKLYATILSKKRKAA